MSSSSLSECGGELGDWDAAADLGYYQCVPVPGDAICGLGLCLRIVVTNFPFLALISLPLCGSLLKSLT